MSTIMMSPASGLSAKDLERYLRSDPLLPRQSTVIAN